VRADGRNVRRLEPGPANRPERRARKMLAQQEIQFTHFSHRPMQARLQDAPPQDWWEALVRVRQHPRPQPASRPRDPRHHRVNAIRRRPGHQPDQEPGTAI